MDTKYEMKIIHELPRGHSYTWPSNRTMKSRFCHLQANVYHIFTRSRWALRGESEGVKRREGEMGEMEEGRDGGKGRRKRWGGG